MTWLVNLLQAIIAALPDLIGAANKKKPPKVFTSERGKDNDSSRKKTMDYVKKRLNCTAGS